MSAHPVTHLTRVQLLALETACVPIAEAFDSHPYLVGSSRERADFRDVDVRLILDDERYDAMPVAVWRLIGMSLSAWLTQMTGLPVDFQIQQRTAANANHVGSRQPMGWRPVMDAFPGDAEP